MIVRNLHYPGSFFPGRQLPAFSDHMLFTAPMTGPGPFEKRSAGLSEFIARPGIFTVLTGSAKFTLNNKKETLDKGQFLLINQGSRVSIALSQPDVQPLFLFFHTEMLQAALDRKETDLVWLERVHPLKGILRERLEWIIRLGNSCASFSALKADSLIRSLMEELVNEAVATNILSMLLPVVKRTTRIDLIQRLSRTREWILANYAAPVTLRDMAAVASLNSQHFLCLFRDCYGITPHRFLTRTRLEAARQLLLSSGETVSAICRQTGFESLSSFSGLFRSRFGKPPSVYRLHNPVGKGSM
jgi:AraC-like DNA-binding protein